MLFNKIIIMNCLCGSLSSLAPVALNNMKVSTSKTAENELHTFSKTDNSKRSNTLK